VRFLQANLTLDGTAQCLLEAMPDPTVGGPDDEKIRQLFLQADDGNSNPVYLGDSEVTVASHAIRIPAPPIAVSEVPTVFGPYEGGMPSLSSIYAIGTATEILNIGIVTE
jgi:hypothetical protein